MHAPVKSNASYIWRSIAEARVIQLDARWRVGDGRSINVWGDNWLPRQIFFKVISPIPAGMDASLKVTNLILEDGTLWNEELITALFWEEEARLVRSIPFSLLKPPDIIMWNAEPNGKFTTKSAYHIARTNGVGNGNSPGASEIGSDIKLLWKALWRACVPGKVKLCVWLSCSKALPTRASLQQQKILTDAFCAFCNGGIETVEHALRDCPRSANIWFSSPLDFRVHEVGNLGWVDWLVRLTSLARESFDLFLVMIWSFGRGGMTLSGTVLRRTLRIFTTKIFHGCKNLKDGMGRKTRAENLRYREVEDTSARMDEVQL